MSDGERKTRKERVQDDASDLSAFFGTRKGTITVLGLGAALVVFAITGMVFL